MRAFKLVSLVARLTLFNASVFLLFPQSWIHSHRTWLHSGILSRSVSLSLSVQSPYSLERVQEARIAEIVKGIQVSKSVQSDK